MRRWKDSSIGYETETSVSEDGLAFADTSEIQLRVTDTKTMAIIAIGITTSRRFGMRTLVP